MLKINTLFLGLMACFLFNSIGYSNVELLPPPPPAEIPAIAKSVQEEIYAYFKTLGVNEWKEKTLEDLYSEGNVDKNRLIDAVLQSEKYREYIVNLFKVKIPEGVDSFTYFSSQKT